MTPDPAWEAEFNRWHDQEHSPCGWPPLALSAPIAIASANAAVWPVDEMDEPAALRTEACGRIKPQPRERTRRMPAGVTGSSRRGSNEIAAARRPNERRRPIDTPILYAWFAAPRDCRADFDAWHDQDHVPIVIQQKD